MFWPTEYVFFLFLHCGLSGFWHHPIDAITCLNVSMTRQMSGERVHVDKNE